MTGTERRVTGGERVEDRALLSGRGRFIDDLPQPPRTLHAAILRSPHAHARIGRITAPQGVRLFTGQDIAAGLKPTDRAEVISVEEFCALARRLAET